MAIGVFGIVISLILLMYLAYKGVPVLILATVLAIFAAFVGGFGAGDPHLLATYTEIYMKSLGGFVISNFPLFMLGAIFGKIMDDTGAAKSIAGFITKKLGKERAIAAVVLACAILTYGGISLFVVAFAVYPIAAELFRESNTPKRFIPGSIALGSFTFTMTAMPGSPQIQNAIPMQYFGTDAYAAPILGLVGSAIILFGGLFWLQSRAKAAMAKGEGYGDHNDEHLVQSGSEDLPGLGVSALPIVVVLGLSLILSKVVFPSMDLSYLEDEPYLTTASKVTGNWSLIVALTSASILAAALNFKRLKNPLESINGGVSGAITAIMNTAAVVGYGGVIRGLAAFALIQGAILGISDNPLISEAISTSVLAGITGSASGGLSIALNSLAETYMQQAEAIGLDPQVLHRIAAIACGGLDTLPHNGAVITLLGVTGLTHKDSYADIGMVSVVIPVIAVTALIILASIGIV